MTLLETFSLHERPGVWRVVRLIVLVVILTGLAVRQPPADDTAVIVTIWVATFLCTLAWIGWLCSSTVHRRQLLVVSLCTLVLAGCVLAGLDPLSPALALGGVGAFTAALVLPLLSAATMCVLGLIALTVSHVAAGATVQLTGCIVAFVVIAVGGFNRRIYRDRLMRQAARLVEQTSRTQAEHVRSAALSERAHIAREIHDVLAHSLGVLAVQLEAADAVLIDGGDPAQVHRHVARARTLAVEGLTETRRAIGALRGDTLLLTDQLEQLVVDHSQDTGTPTELSVDGSPRIFPAEVTLTVYRTAQEALTNCRKHAPRVPAPRCASSRARWR